MCKFITKEYVNMIGVFLCAKNDQNKVASSKQNNKNVESYLKPCEWIEFVFFFLFNGNERG